MADKRNVMGVNPTLGNITPGDLAKLQTLAPQYYQYLQNPDTFDYNTLPTGTNFAQLGKYSGYNIDYDTLRNQLKTQADTKAAATAATAKTAADAEAAKVAATQKRTTDIGTAKSIATRTGDDLIRQWGLDPSQYEGKLTTSLDDLIAGLGDSADPYASLNGADVATKLLNGEQTAQRNQLTQQANQKFGATYGDKLIDSHLLDGVVSDILGQQSGSAKDYLERGKARGIYNETGYSAGEQALNNQASAGRSQLGSLANNVLDTYRTKANGVRDNAYGAASGFTLGSPINLDDYVGQGDQIKQQATEFGGGDLRTALGGTNFFDFSGLTNAAGAAQGATNLRDSNISAILAERNKNALAGRGLGSQGAF